MFFPIQTRLETGSLSLIQDVGFQAEAQDPPYCRGHGAAFERGFPTAHHPHLPLRYEQNQDDGFISQTAFEEDDF